MEIGTLPFELSFLPLGKWAYMLLSDRYTRQVGLDGTVLLSVPTAVAREVDYPIAGATGVGSFFEMVWGQQILIGMGKLLLRVFTLVRALK